jgi:hypothetical protein
VAIDIFGAEGFRRLVRSGATNADTPHAGLKCADFGELGSGGFEALEERPGIEAPSVLRAAFHATVVAFPYPVERGGLGDGRDRSITALISV